MTNKFIEYLAKRLAEDSTQLNMNDPATRRALNDPKFAELMASYTQNPNKKMDNEKMAKQIVNKSRQTDTNVDIAAKAARAAKNAGIMGGSI